MKQIATLLFLTIVHIAYSQTLSEGDRLEGIRQQGINISLIKVGMVKVNGSKERGVAYLILNKTDKTIKKLKGSITYKDRPAFNVNVDLDNISLGAEMTVKIEIDNSDHYKDYKSTMIEEIGQISTEEYLKRYQYAFSLSEIVFEDGEIVKAK